jgi:hypothetical protein
VHVSFLGEKGDKLLGIHSWPLSGSVEFSDDFFIARTHLGGLRQRLRVDIIPDVRQSAISPALLRTNPDHFSRPNPK